MNALYKFILSIYLWSATVRGFERYEFGSGITVHCRGSDNRGRSANKIDKRRDKMRRRIMSPYSSVKMLICRTRIHRGSESNSVRRCHFAALIFIGLVSLPDQWVYARIKMITLRPLVEAVDDSDFSRAWAVWIIDVLFAFWGSTSTFILLTGCFVRDNKVLVDQRHRSGKQNSSSTDPCSGKSAEKYPAPKYPPPEDYSPSRIGSGVRVSASFQIFSWGNSPRKE